MSQAVKGGVFEEELPSFGKGSRSTFLTGVTLTHPERFAFGAQLQRQDRNQQEVLVDRSDSVNYFL